MAPATPKIQVGTRLKELRVREDLSQSELAERTGVSQANVSRWETSGEVPERRMEALATALDVTFDELRADDDTDTAEKDDRVARTGDELNRWRNLVIERHASGELFPDDVPDRARATVSRAMLAMPMDDFWEDGVASFTLEDLAAKMGTDLDRLQEWWPKAFETGMVRRVGSGRWTVRLTFPEGE